MSQTSITRPLILIALSLLPVFYLLTQFSVLSSSMAAWANMFGLVGIVLLWWELVLGIRYLAAWLTPNRQALVNLHMLLGIYGMFFILLHPLMEMLVYVERLGWLFGPSFADPLATQITYGRIALILLVLIWITSAIVRERLRYTVWIYIHYLTYVIAGLSLAHVLVIGSFFNNVPLIRLYWYFLAGSYVLMVVYRAAKTFLWRKARYTLAGKRRYPDGVTGYWLKPQDQRLRPLAGQFFYLKWKLWSRSHPFTVMEIEDKHGGLQFGVKALGPFTQALSELPVGALVYVDGPYGTFTREITGEQPAVMLAGGIGVTPFIESVRRRDNQRLYLFYSVKQTREVLYPDELKQLLGKRLVTVTTREQRPAAAPGRIDKNLLVNVLPDEVRAGANYFICGSPRFIEGMKALLAELRVPKSRIFSEDFGP